MSFFSSFLEDFFKEIIFTLFFSSGLMAVYIAKMRKALNETSIGITHVHKHGKDVKNLIKAMQSAREINIIAFVPFSFVFDNRELLTKKNKGRMYDKNSIMPIRFAFIKRNISN